MSEHGSSTLLESYATIARMRRPRDLEETALRTRSSSLRALLAHLASDGQHSYTQIAAMSEDQIGSLNPRWTMALGRVIGFQNLAHSDLDSAIRILYGSTACALPRERLSFRRVLSEFLYSTGRWDEVHQLLETDPNLRSMGDGYLATDLQNPFTATPYADTEGWRQGFSRRFELRGLTRPELLPTGASAFDRLSAGPSSAVDGPLVTVVMTAYQPELGPLTTSVRSILDQSWKNLELIIVDDCSPINHDRALDSVAALDERIRIIRMPVNKGTYLARNAGIKAARGEIVTGQDDDDWSHPERIARQIEPMLANPDIPATRSRCITVNNDLVMQRPGYDPVRPNASSLMFRTEMVRRIGGFHPSRRGADSELFHRIEMITDHRVYDLVEPLSLVRIRTDSLSRSDFRPGWHHPARRAFRSAFTRWHQVTPIDALIADEASPAIPIPDRFAVVPRTSAPPDVVVAADWRIHDDTVRAAVDEIRTLPSSIRLGLLQIDSARNPSRRNDPLCGPVQDLINGGRATRVLDDDPIHVAVAIIRDPDVLVFPPDEPFRLTTHALYIVADHDPTGDDRAQVRYEVELSSTNAARLFGCEATWVPTRTTVRRAIKSHLDEGALSEFDMPPVLFTDRWRTDRVSPRANRPVIGRTVTNDPTSWPDSSESLHAVYPPDGRLDVRFRGNPEVILRALGATPRPGAWLTFSEEELDMRTFLSSLDFFVYYPPKQVGAAFQMRSVVEALAAGCVAILPPAFKEVFGEGAVYAEEEDAVGLAFDLIEDRSAYEAASRKGISWVEAHVDNQAYASRIQQLLRRSVNQRGDAIRRAG